MNLLSMRSVATKLAKSIFDPQKIDEALCQVVLEKSLQYIHGQKGCPYVFPETLVKGDQINHTLINQAFTTLVNLRLLKMIMVDVKFNKKQKNQGKRARTEFVVKKLPAYTTSYSAMTDAILAYARQVESSIKKALPTRSYCCKVCNLTTWIPELLEKITESEWKNLESKTKNTPKNLWKCKNCKNASVILEPIDEEVHKDYNSVCNNAHLSVVDDVTALLRDLGRDGLIAYVARQDMHDDEVDIDVVLGDDEWLDV